MNLEMTNNATEDEREKSEKQKTLIFIVNVRKKQYFCRQ